MINPPYFNRNNRSMISLKVKSSILSDQCFKPGIYHFEGVNGSLKSSLLRTDNGIKKTIDPIQNTVLQQLLSSISPDNIRCIDPNSILVGKNDRFNQQILGPDLSNTMFWYGILSIKTKYLFSTKLRKELLISFEQVESAYYQREHQCLSFGERILISCMFVLTTWDKDVSILVVDESCAYLDTKMGWLFLQCLNELSIRTAVFITADEDMNSPVEFDFKFVS